MRALSFLHASVLLFALHNHDANAYMAGTGFGRVSLKDSAANRKTTNMNTIITKARSWMRARNTARELANLSNEALSDIGLTRYDIDTVARRGRGAR